MSSKEAEALARAIAALSRTIQVKRAGSPLDAADAAAEDAERSK